MIKNYSMKKNILQYFTVNSDVDRKIQICSFREGRVGISRYLKTDGIFDTFGQSGLKVNQESNIVGKEQSASSRRLLVDNLK